MNTIDPPAPNPNDNNNHDSVQFYSSPSFEDHLSRWVTHYQVAQKSKKAKKQTPFTPFAPATLIVHSHAMAMYLKNTLAKKLGVATRIRFLLPATFDREVRNTLLHSTPTSNPLNVLRGDSIFDSKYLEWIILSIISNKENHTALRNLPVLGNYLFSNKDGKKYPTSTFLPLRAVEFAGQMARVFNRYLFFREFQLRDWEDGHMEPSSEHIWQQWLWQQITTIIAPATYRENELAEIKTTLHTNLAASSLLLQNQFGYTSIFAISYLPPYYLDLLNALVPALPLDFFYFDSTKPILTPTPSSTTVKESQQTLYYPAFFEELGTMSNAFLELIERQNWTTTNFGNPPVINRGSFSPNDKHTITADLSVYGFNLILLPSIKSFFNEPPDLKNFSKEPPDPLQPHTIFSDLQIHSCPNLLVEVEVTKNQILWLMESNPNLSADNILILAPDIDQYDSYLEVVMNRSPRIPYGIMDYKENSQNQILNAVFYILELFQSDFRVSKLIPLLERECVNTYGGWTNSELNQFVELVKTLGIRWGAEDSENHWLEKYSWKTGIEKIMNSYACSTSFALNGEEAKSIGKIIYWLQNLFSIYEQSTPTSLIDWLARLNEIVAMLLFKTRKGYQYSRELNRDHTHFQKLIKDLHRELTLTNSSNLGKKHSFNFSSDFSLDLINFTKLLQSNLKDRDFLARTPTGVMCGSLLPLRTIPAEATFLLGMNRENFPRHDDENQFDLILKKPQPLDRTKKKDDQLLFFETIFSTRSYLSISYSPSASFEYSENTSPSTLVDGLIHEICERVSHPKHPHLIDSIKHEHPPHAFCSSPERFHPESTLREYSASIYSQAKLVHSLSQDHSQSTNEVCHLQNWVNRWSKLNDYLDHLDHLIDKEDKDNHKNSSHSTISSLLVDGINNLLKNKSVSTQLGGGVTNSQPNININTQDLITWITNPVEQYYKRVLKANFELSDEQLSTAEPLELDSLNKYQLLSPLIKKYLHEIFTDKNNTKAHHHKHFEHFAPDLVETHSQLPAGNPGKSELYQLELTLAEIKNQLAVVRENFSPKQFSHGVEELELCEEYNTDEIFNSSLLPEIDLSMKGKLPEKIQVHGWIEAFRLDKNLKLDSSYRVEEKNHSNCIARIYVRYTKIKTKDLVRAWVEHILLCLSQTGKNTSVETWLVGQDKIKLFSPLTPELAESELKRLLNLYILAHSTPIPVHELIIEKFLTENKRKKDKPPSEIPNLINELVPEKNDFTPRYESFIKYVHKIWNEVISNASEVDLQQSNKILYSLHQNLWTGMAQHLEDYPPTDKPKKGN